MRSKPLRWLVCGAAMAAAGAAADTMLQPFAAAGSAPAAPWKVTGLPNQTKPFTRFSVVDLDGHKALKVEAESSYGNLVHPLHLEKPARRPRGMRSSTCWSSSPSGASRCSTSRTTGTWRPGRRAGSTCWTAA